jgi:glyceraldehyde 3-phosphate dehydrogenase
LPKLQGKLTASAIRVPTPNVSMAILMLNLKTATSSDGVNDILRRVSMTSRCAQIGYSTSTEVCSSDFVGHRSAGIVDAPRTSYLEQRVNLYVWYDNEFGYSCQVMRLVQKLAGVQHKIFPPSKAFDDAVVHEK